MTTRNVNGVVETLPAAEMAAIEAEWAANAAKPAPVPEDITFAQLLIGLEKEQWITEAEADAWLTGTIPAAAVALINRLPTGDRFGARARMLRPSAVLRNDPLVVALAAEQGRTPADLDAFFITYSQA